MNKPPLRLAQMKMRDFLRSRKRGAIWADPGIGKTRPVLEFVETLKLTQDVGPVLVIAPKRVATITWPEEAKKWSGLTASYVYGEDFNPKADIHTANYERIPQLVETGATYKIIIVDEASKLKGLRLRQGAVRAAALRSIAWEADYLFELTGTPAANSLLDLWGQLWFIDKGFALGSSFTVFKNKWFIEHAYTKAVTPLPSAAEEIAARIAPIVLTLKAEDYMDLPQEIEVQIPVMLSEHAAKLYRKLEKEFIAEICEGENITAANAMVVSGKLLQIANGGAYVDGTWTRVHDAKIDALRDLVQEYQHPLLVSYWFRPDLDALRLAFPQAASIDDPGSLEKWNAGDLSMLLIHPMSAGHGLSLHKPCRAICFYSEWWSLELRQQTIARIGAARQAQEGRVEPVMIYSIIARGTVDELLPQRHKTKKEVEDLLRRYIKEKACIAENKVYS